MGIVYYQVKPDVITANRALIDLHEVEVVGPRARGYWFDQPSDFDYESVQQCARDLDQIGAQNALERLQISEPEAHALSLLEIEVPHDGKPMPPQLFLTSLTPEGLQAHMDALQEALGDDPDAAPNKIGATSRDPRYAPYLRKMVGHLREVLPRVWKFHQSAVDAGSGVLVIDLRARDLFIPDPIEREALEEN